MDRRLAMVVAALSVWGLNACTPTTSFAQEQFQYESDLIAARRIFPATGAGFRTLRVGPNGRYYVLTAPSPAVQIYDSDEKKIGQIPSETATLKKGVALVYGESFDVDAQGNLAVSDRGAGTVKIFARDGSLLTSIPVAGPSSVAFLHGEVAVASASARQLITVYSLDGKLVREYGDREEFADRADVDRQLNLGQIVTDASDATYFAFDYLPEPTVRKFDRVGYLLLEISLKTLEFQPAAQAARRSISRAEGGVPALHRIITAIGVDPPTGEVWLAIGTLVMHFDKDGRHLASFRTFLPNGGRIEPAMIIVQPHRLLMGSDPQGIYEFPRPDVTTPQ